MDIKHVLSCNPIDPTYVEPAPIADAPLGRPPWLDRRAGRQRRDRPRRRRLRLRQRVTRATSVYLEPFRIADRLVTARRVVRVHRRRRLPPRRAVAVRRLVRGAGATSGTRRSTGATTGRRLVGVHARRAPRARPRRTRRARQPLRGRRVRPLGAAPRLPTEFEWEHVGSVDRGRPPRARLPRRLDDVGLAVDGERVPRRTRASTRAPGAVGEYNGKFMSGQMMLRGGALHHAGRPRPRDLPQLLPAREPLDVRRRAARGGRVTRSEADSPSSERAPSVPDVHAAASDVSSVTRGRDVRAGLTADAEGHPAEVVLRRPRLAAVRRDHTAPRVLPDASRAGDPRAHGAGDRRRSRRRHARRARLGHVGEDARCCSTRCATRGSWRASCRSTSSKQTLHDAAAAIEREYPGVDVQPVVGDFTLDLDVIPRAGRRLVAFLGGTIGNLLPAARARVPRTTSRRCSAPTTPSCSAPISSRTSPGSKPRTTTRGRHRRVQQERAARDEPRARRRLRRRRRSSTSRCGTTSSEWIEMRLRSTCAQTVGCAALDLEVEFAAGEEMRTEVSAKFRRDGVAAELAAAGLEPVDWWTDARRRLRAVTLAVTAASRVARARPTGAATTSRRRRI